MIFVFDLDAIGEFDAFDDLGQLISSFQAAPVLGGGHDQLEDHGEGGFVGEAALGADGPATMSKPNVMIRSASSIANET